MKITPKSEKFMLISVYACIILGDDNQICEGGDIIWSCNDPTYPFCCRYDGVWYCCRDNPSCCYSEASDVLIALAKPTSPKQADIEPEVEIGQGNPQAFDIFNKNVNVHLV